MVFRVWEVATWNQLARFETPGPWWLGLCLSSNGRRLAAGGDVDSAFVWDMEREVVFRLRGEGMGLAAEPALAAMRAPISPMQFSPDGGTLLFRSGGEAYPVYQWDFEKGSIRELPYLRQFALFAFSPDGTTLAFVPPRPHHNPEAGPVMLWFPGEERQLRLGDYQAIALAFSPDGKTLAMATRNSDVRHEYDLRFWQVATGEELFTVPGPIQGSGVARVSLSFASDGRTLLLTGLYSGSVRSVYAFRAARGMVKP